MRRILLSLIILLMSVLALSSFGAGQRIGRLFNDRIVVAGEYSGFCQDREGYVWIGTSKGLLRFDGNSYDIYRHEDSASGSISDNRILGVMCDSKGRVWVATANGLNLYQATEDNFKVISLPGRDFFGYIIGIAEQLDGTVTFVASGIGLYVVADDSGEPVAVKYFGGDMEKDINTIVCGPKGRIYMGTRDGRLHIMASNGKVTTMNVSGGAYIRALAVEADGNVLVSTLSDLYRLYPDSRELRRLAIDGDISIRNLSNAAGSDIYIATSGQGLWRIGAGSDDAARCTDIYCPFMKIETAKIGAVYNSPDGNLWLGCDYKG
ncbi:MAG: hypothetical protein K2L00_07730, partial [Muribaculaceae bacterium]|nr:hypothetical protein [Muribaculaceae bacterium]